MDLIEKVTEKKPYSFINRDFVKKLGKIIKAKTEKEKVKPIRAKLRKISTSALPLKFYRKFESIKFSRDILNLHRSTKERMGIYPWLIDKISKQKPEKIIDFGCGFNLTAFFYFDFIPKEYIGYDVDCAVINFLKRFAKEKNLNASLFCQDIFEVQFKQADLCLCLKLFDAIEDIELNVTKKLLKEMSKNTKNIIASFSNISLSGRSKLRKRGWFEKVLKDLDLTFNKETKGNETFYFIKC